MGESEGRERKKNYSLLSKIYENWIVDFRLSKRQSWFTHRELRLDTKILEFHRIPRDREFVYLGYLYIKNHLMIWDLLRSRKF